MKKIILSLWILLFGINLSADIIQENEKACKKGDARGCFLMGFSYDMGDGVEQNYLKAKEFYAKACDSDNIDGCLNLGVIYFFGKGVEKDCLKAKHFFKKNCKLGDMRGCYILGTMYYSCKTCSCITPNFVKAKDFVNKACMGGYTVACDALKTIDIPNFYTKMADDLLAQNNILKALEYYNKALKNMGEKHPDKILCYMGIGSVYGVMRDNSKALEYFKKALNIVENESNKENINHIILYKKIALVYEITGSNHLDNTGFLVQGNRINYFIALDYREKALTLSKKLFGEMNLIVADSYYEIAPLYIMTRADGMKTLEYYMKALDIKEKILGKEHPDTIPIRKKIEETHNILLKATQSAMDKANQ